MCAIVLALDLSLTSTGYALPGESGTLVPPKGASRGPGRLRWIQTQVMRLASGASLVVIEGAAFGGARGTSRLHAAGQLSGVIVLALHVAGIPVVELPPASLKRLATGRGNAPKGEVLAAAIRRLGYAGHSDDEADALWLLQAAAHMYGLPGAVELPKLHLEKLATAATWPELPGLLQS